MFAFDNYEASRVEAFMQLESAYNHALELLRGHQEAVYAAQQSDSPLPENSEIYTVVDPWTSGYLALAQQMLASGDAPIRDMNEIRNDLERIFRVH